MNYDLVSIITPVFNGENFIEQSINSVINQTYLNWELIIVDDASTDDTVKIVEMYMRKDKRIRFFKNQTNKGVDKSREKAFLNAKGRFIAFLDADDIWMKRKLEKQVKYMLENNYYFTFTDYYMFNDGSNKPFSLVHVPNEIDYKGYLKNTVIGCLSVILDKNNLDLNMQQGKLEDVKTWLYVLKQGYKAYGIQEPLAFYRVCNTSASSNKLKNASLFYNCMVHHEKINRIAASYYFINYIMNAFKKRNSKIKDDINIMEALSNE